LLKELLFKLTRIEQESGWNRAVRVDTAAKRMLS
jgi:hypothetical protein